MEKIEIEKGKIFIIGQKFNANPLRFFLLFFFLLFRVGLSIFELKSVCGWFQAPFLFRFVFYFNFFFVFICLLFSLLVTEEKKNKTCLQFWKSLSVLYSSGNWVYIFWLVHNKKKLEVLRKRNKKRNKIQTWPVRVKRQ